MDNMSQLDGWNDIMTKHTASGAALLSAAELEVLADFDGSEYQTGQLKALRLLIRRSIRRRVREERRESGVL